MRYEWSRQSTEFPRVHRKSNEVVVRLPIDIDGADTRRGSIGTKVSCCQSIWHDSRPWPQVAAVSNSTQWSCTVETGGKMTDERADRQSCCDTPVREERSQLQTQQGCCDADQKPPDSPRSNIENDCCGSVKRGDASQEALPTEQTHTGERHPTDGREDDQETPSISPNQKSQTELKHLERAADETTALLQQMAEAWRPDWSEADVASFLHDAVQEQGLETAWTQAHCPAVHAGPDAAVGHVAPGDRTVSPGELLHIDFGVASEGYVADLQRVFYRGDNTNGSIPSELQTAFSDVRAALEAGRNVLVPGVPGYQVDAVARRELTSRGWDAYNHAFGHQVGTIPHDRGTLLGPLWDRYGDNPRGVVRSDQVYSLELGVGTRYGYVGLEEMVRVTADGASYLVDPQTEILRLADGPVEDEEDTAD